MREALLTLLAKMDGHDVVAALAIIAGACIGVLGLTYACGYEINFEKDRVAIQKANRFSLEALEA